MKDFAKFVDHTLLKAEATEEQIHQLCKEASTYKFFSVCVNGVWVPMAKQLLKNTGVAVCTVIGFPLGASSSETKCKEAEYALKDGADELDLVFSIGVFKSKNNNKVFDEMKSVVELARGKIVKIIIETALLDQEEKIRAAELVLASGAAFIKTSTGMSTSGATVDDIRLLRKIMGPDKGVKASGGIRTRAFAEELIEAGANRLGLSQSVKILNESAS